MISTPESSESEIGERMTEDDHNAVLADLEVDEIEPIEPILRRRILPDNYYVSDDSDDVSSPRVTRRGVKRSNSTSSSYGFLQACTVAIPYLTLNLKKKQIRDY